MIFLFYDDWHDMAIMDEAQEDLHYGVQEGDADALIEDETHPISCQNWRKSPWRNGNHYALMVVSLVVEEYNRKMML